MIAMSRETFFAACAQILRSVTDRNAHRRRVTNEYREALFIVDRDYRRTLAEVAIVLLSELLGDEPARSVEGLSDDRDKAH